MHSNQEKPRTLRRAETKTPSTERVVYACGECGEVRDTREKADACCVCPKCKRTIVDAPEHGEWRGGLCRRCTVKEHIRSRREAIRRYESSLADSRKSLAELLDEKASLDGLNVEKVAVIAVE